MLKPLLKAYKLCGLAIEGFYYKNTIIGAS